MFKSTGVYLVLFWATSSLFVYSWVIDHSPVKSIALSGATAVVVNAVIIVYPVFGLIADAYYGRYKVIKWSMRMMWVISCLYCVLSILDKTTLRNGTFYIVMDKLLKAALMAALGGVLTNIVVLGIDQLADAPSHKIVWYIEWCGWLWFFAELAVSLTQTCRCKGYEIIYSLEIPILLTLSLCLDLLCSHHLSREPAFPNPLMTIYGVMKYAWKNKYPRLQSSFTYWNGKRIDLAKTKFGGPFTATQVDDVKTIGRLVILMTVFSILPTQIVVINDAVNRLEMQLEGCKLSRGGCSKACVWRKFINNFGIFFVLVTYPLYKIFLYPIFKNCCHMSLFKKMMASTFLIALSIMGMGLIDRAGQHKYQAETSFNQTSACVIDISKCSKESDSLPLSINWTIFPLALLAYGKYMLIVSVGELLCAQAPSSMKGLMFGLTYAIGGVSLIVNLAWLLPLQMLIKKWSPEGSCGTIYFFTLFGIELAIGVATFGISKCYKRRERNEEEDTPTKFNNQYRKTTELM